MKINKTFNDIVYSMSNFINRKKKGYNIFKNKFSFCHPKMFILYNETSEELQKSQHVLLFYTYTKSIFVFHEHCLLGISWKP
jgi:hypothetical protein